MYQQYLALSPDEQKAWCSRMQPLIDELKRKQENARRLGLDCYCGKIAVGGNNPAAAFVYLWDGDGHDYVPPPADRCYLCGCEMLREWRERRYEWTCGEATCGARWYLKRGEGWRRID